jgi:hypothetical protein
MWVLRLATVLTGIGFYEFETSKCPFTRAMCFLPYARVLIDLVDDVGITEAVARVWKA